MSAINNASFYFPSSGVAPADGWWRVTPEIARLWLARNVNRRVRAGVVKYLAEQIQADKFYRVGDAVAFTKNWVMYNGQHRLLAIILANKPADLLVTTNMPEDSIRVTDRGKNKTVSDVTGLGPGLLADASMIAHIAYPTLGRVPEYLQEDISAWWSPVYQKLFRKPLGRKLNNASVHIGLGLRWAIEEDADRREELYKQLNAMLDGDTPVMTKATATMWRRMMVEPAAGSQMVRITRAATVYHYMDPRRSAVEPVLKSPDPAIEEMRRVLTVMEAAYVAAPLGATHPYDFSGLHSEMGLRRYKPAPSKGSGKSRHARHPVNLEERLDAR